MIGNRCILTSLLLWIISFRSFEFVFLHYIYEITKTCLPRAGLLLEKQKTSSWPVTGLWNRGPLKILNGIKLILDDQGNHLGAYLVRLESFRSFRGPLFHKPVTGQELVFATQYKKLALAKYHCNALEFYSNPRRYYFQPKNIFYWLINKQKAT